jgi:hypothetical protein
LPGNWKSSFPCAETVDDVTSLWKPEEKPARKPQPIGTVTPKISII